MGVQKKDMPKTEDKFDFSKNDWSKFSEIVHGKNSALLPPKSATLAKTDSKLIILI